MGTNDLTFTTNTDPTINAALTGTGTLTFQGLNTTTSIGLAGAAGTINLDSGELDNITDGWSNIVFGRADSTGAITANAFSNWKDAVTFLKDGTDTTNAIAINGTQEAASSSDGAFTFNGNTQWNGDLITHGGDITFVAPLTLTSNRTATANGGDINFDDTVDGAYDLSLATGGNINFANDVGGTTRLGNMIVTGGNDVTAANKVNTASFTQTGGTGTTALNGDGLNTTGDVSVTTTDISGTFAGTNGFLDSGVGNINAKVSFNALDINGATATLLGGYIGTPGTATQAMANLIRVNGVLLPIQSPNFTFGGFMIGTVYVPPVPPVPPPETPTPSLTNADIVRILTEPQYLLRNTSSSVSLVEAPAEKQDDILISTHSNMDGDWVYIIEDLLSVHPALQNRIRITLMSQ
jgi:hypothetical protein